MKIFTLAVLSAYLLLCNLSLFAQQHPGCGFETGHQKLMQTNPRYRAAVEQQEAAIKAYAQKSNGARVSGGVYIMPVVVHIVHTGGLTGSTYNPTDDQIRNVIAYLNNVYKGIDPGQNGEGVGDIGIQFELAKRDPNCNPTTGINHVDGSSLAGYTAYGVKADGPDGIEDITLKNFIRWDATKYCNVWVVNKIDGIDGSQGGGTGGYGYFPFDPTVDGVVIRAIDMTPGNTVLPHEMGHVFALYHPFEGSGADGTMCPVNTDPANDGDKVADTDPVKYPGFANPERTDPATAGGNTNPCTGLVYNNNTEHNIMSYVINPRLFTAGQKTRMLNTITANAEFGNYRIMQINSNGDYTPDAGTVCPANKMSFELSEYRITEQTAATVTTGGCTRNYKDYTFNLMIGKAPSANATATLTASGATEGVDFDITSNGSFSAPSKALVFPTGTNASKSFTVRIYDEASINTTKTITLGFNVTGGDAVAGNANTNLVIKVTDNDAAPYASFNGNATLNGDYNFSDGNLFAGHLTAVRKSQFIYKASELAAAGIVAGQLTGLTFNIIKKGGASFVYKNLTIRIGQTTSQTLYNVATTAASPLNSASLTTVYSSDYTTVNGPNSFSFISPFTWDGTSSVVVTICYDNAGVLDAVNDEVSFYSDDYANFGSFIFASDACATNWSGFQYFNTDYKPVINFSYIHPGTSVQTGLNASKSEYLGPNTDVYFYDQTSSQLMARVKNLTSFDYGCTQVVIDRAGTTATAFQSSSTSKFLMDKTFRVVPTTNNASGQYEITLYYTQAEVNGWQTATGQSFSNIQLVKVPNQIKDASPGNPGGAGNPLQVDPVRGTLGSNYSLTYTFNTGFSGFGAGVNAVVLPVRLTDINAVISGSDIIVSWQTSSEINSKQFEVERSTDGISFTRIGIVAAAGNSSLNISYAFKDLNFTDPVNYYRIRIEDKDGKAEYSKIVTVKAPGINASFTALNPVKDALYLLFGNINAGAAEIRLLNVSGQVVLRWKGMAGNGQRLSIPLNSAIGSGIYTVQVLVGDKQFIKKVIKE